jgi:ABC-type sugar transport system substrate-binding protein
MKRLRLTGLVGLVLLVVAAPGAAQRHAAAPAHAQAKHSHAVTKGAMYTPAQVAAASKPWQCKPVYPVPASDKGVKLAFINPGPADPYVAAWSFGYKAAAKFYGENLKEAFLGNYAFSKLIDQYHSLSAFNPDVVGALGDSGTGLALLAATKADHRKLVFIDTIVKGGIQIGLQNAQGGKLEGQALKTSVVPLLSGAWKGHKVVVVGFSGPGCEPCDQRVQGAFDEIKTFLPNAKYLFLRDVADNVNAAQVRMTNEITAFPGADFVVASLDDETGGGAFNAIRQAKIEDRARLATIGGDNLAIANLLKHSPSYVASIDAKPFCEAWNWVEAALAVKDGKTFKPYPFTGILTPANVASYKWRLKIKF